MYERIVKIRKIINLLAVKTTVANGKSVEKMTQILTVPWIKLLDWYRLEVFARGIVYDILVGSLCIRSPAFLGAAGSNDYIHHIISHCGRKMKRTLFKDEIQSK